MFWALAGGRAVVVQVVLLLLVQIRASPPPRARDPSAPAPNETNAPFPNPRGQRLSRGRTMAMQSLGRGQMAPRRSRV